MSYGDEDSGVFVGNHHCIANESNKEKKCNSSDALSCYEKETEDGEIYYDGYCRSCSQFFSKDDIHTFDDTTPLKQELADLLGIASTGVVNTKTRKIKPKAIPLTPEQVKAMFKEVGYNSKHTYVEVDSRGEKFDVVKDYRGITEETCRFYGCITKQDGRGRVSARYYPETESWKVVGFACRNHPKDFRYGRVGRTGSKSQLYGQVKFKKGNGKYLLIVGGQEDAKAAYQMLRDSQISRGQSEYEPIAVVSVTTGEGSGYKQLAQEYDWIDTFENIILAFDADEAGEEAATKAIEVLPKEKVKLATWSGKDPNKMLMDGKEKQFLRDFYSAKEVIDMGVKSSADAVDDVKDFLLAPKIPLPPHLWRLQENMRGGIRSTGEIVNIIADTSVGKTFFSDTLLLYWFFNSPVKPTIISLERSSGELLIDMYSLYLKYNLMYVKNGQEAVDYLERPEIKLKCNEVIYDEGGEPRFHMIDEKGSSVKDLQKAVDRVIKQYGCRMIVWDPLSDYLRGLGNEEQESFMMWQKYLKKDGITSINILHTRKPMPDKDGKIRKVTEFDALGSGSFVQSADINIILNRDKMASDGLIRNTTEVDMPKRRGGITGHAQDLVYDQETRQQYDKQDYLENILNTKPKEIIEEDDNEA